MNKIDHFSVPDFRERDFPKNIRLLHFSKLSHEISRIDVESCEDLIYSAEFLSKGSFTDYVISRWGEPRGVSKCLRF